MDRYVNGITDRVFPSPCGVNIVGNPRPMNTIYYAVFKVRFLQLT